VQKGATIPDDELDSHFQRKREALKETILFTGKMV
jgi:hypothetical protein